MENFSGDQALIIAEVGSNHGGDLNYAKRLAALAKSSGAHAVKFQTFVAEKLVNQELRPDRFLHFNRLALSTNEFTELAKYCEQIEIMFMSSVWDADSLNQLDKHLQVHKIGSGDITNYQLIKSIISKNKPLIISTAMATMEEIRAVVSYISSLDANYISAGKLCVLHCVAMYGEPLERFANFDMYHRLQKEFPDIEIGYSDHVRGSHAVLHALSCGAKIIEVHFTDNKDQEFRDHHLSVTPKEMEKIIQYSSDIQKFYDLKNQDIVSEIETIQRIQDFRRGVYLNRNMKSGDIIAENDLICLRPENGIKASEFEGLIGKKLVKDVRALSELSFDLLEKKKHV